MIADIETMAAVLKTYLDLSLTTSVAGNSYLSSLDFTPGR
jgi:hypothetical protein